MMITKRAGRLALSAALVASTATGVGFGGAASASAGDYGCSGNLVWGPTPFYGEGAYTNTVVAYVYGYWNGTDNCEVAVKNVFKGQSTRTGITVWTNNGSGDDTNYYSYYAGPVSVNGVGSCVWEEVDMWDANNNEIAQSYNGNKHNCG